MQGFVPLDDGYQPVVGAPQPRGDMRTFVDWLARQDYADTTRALYIRCVARFDEWLRARGYSITNVPNWKAVRDYARTLPNTYGSRNAFKSALLAFAKSTRWDECPAWAVEVPKAKRGVYRGFSSDEEKDRFLQAAATLGPEPYAACCLLYYQALRRHEAAQVRWEEVASGRIRGIGKGRMEFDRPLHDKTAAALAHLTPDGPWVFPGRTPGTHISPNQVWFWCRLAGERAGLGLVTPHQLRHTSIAVFQDAVGMRAAADHARHTDTRHTMRYTRTTGLTEREGMQAL